MVQLALILQYNYLILLVNVFLLHILLVHGANFASIDKERKWPMSKEMISKVLTELQSASITDDAHFHSLIRQSELSLGLTDVDFAREFTVSRSTITRWRNGANAPHPLMRKHVYSWIKARAKKQLKNLEIFEESESSKGKSGGNRGSKPPMAASGRY